MSVNVLNPHFVLMTSAQMRMRKAVFLHFNLNVKICPKVLDDSRHRRDTALKLGIPKLQKKQRIGEKTATVDRSAPPSPQTLIT